MNVAEEMGIAKQYAEPVHARAWQLLGQQLGGHYDQLAARKQALDTVKKMPWVKYEFLLEYAEWLVLKVAPAPAAPTPPPCSPTIYGAPSVYPGTNLRGAFRLASPMPPRRHCGLPSTSSPR